MVEIASRDAEVEKKISVDEERLQFAQRLVPILNDALTGDTPVDELKARLRVAIGGPGGEQELVAILRSDVEKEPFSAQEAEVVAAKIPEQKGLDERLKALVVDPIDALPEDKRTVRGKVRTGAEIARAIPDVEAFLAEVNLQRKDGILLDFFEVNADGQLVMKDDCSEAYGLGENALEARIRQTRVVYKDTDGQTQVMTGKEYFAVTKARINGIPLEIKVSEKALSIDKSSILMQRGLPTLQWTGEKHVGEYARMNNGQLELETYTFTDDENLPEPQDGDDPKLPDFSRARFACWNQKHVNVFSVVRSSNKHSIFRGSRGVLRVNLNLES